MWIPDTLRDFLHENRETSAEEPRQALEVLGCRQEKLLTNNVNQSGNILPRNCNLLYRVCKSHLLRPRLAVQKACRHLVEATRS